MTIVTYGFFGLVVATVSSLLLYLLAKRRVRDAGASHHRLVVASVFAPFLGLLWLVAALLLHVAISNRLAHQDCGLSGDPYVTLPNGYVLGSANTYDGYIAAPGYKRDVPVTGPGYVRSIIDLQWKDGYFSGTQFDFKTSSVRRFIFNTRDRSIQTFDASPLSWQAGQADAHNDASSYWNLYKQYRHHWPNVVLLVLIAAGEAAIAFWLWRIATTVQRGSFQD